MPHLITLRDLHERDKLVLRDLVRFGVLADDQIERRYQDAALAANGLALLLAGGFVNKPRSDIIQGAIVYTASRYGGIVARCGLKAQAPRDTHLAHDIAVVDLADYLLRHNPRADWKTEREVGRALRQIGPATRGRGLSRERRHTPDGLLLDDGKCLAIELEHSDKGEQRYVGICRWFAVELRLNGVHWYVDNPKIITRIKKANRQHGFDRDIEVMIEPFPPGVVMRSQARPWAP
jgi:hypothetical protein